MEMFVLMTNLMPESIWPTLEEAKKHISWNTSNIQKIDGFGTLYGAPVHYTSMEERLAGAKKFNQSITLYCINFDYVEGHDPEFPWFISSQEAQDVCSESEEEGIIQDAFVTSVTKQASYFKEVKIPEWINTNRQYEMQEYSGDAF